MKLIHRDRCRRAEVKALLGQLRPGQLVAAMVQSKNRHAALRITHLRRRNRLRLDHPRGIFQRDRGRQPITGVGDHNPQLAHHRRRPQVDRIKAAADIAARHQLTSRFTDAVLTLLARFKLALINLLPGHSVAALGGITIRAAAQTIFLTRRRRRQRHRQVRPLTIILNRSRCRIARSQRHQQPNN